MLLLASCRGLVMKQTVWEWIDGMCGVHVVPWNSYSNYESYRLRILKGLLSFALGLLATFARAPLQLGCPRAAFPLGSISRRLGLTLKKPHAISVSLFVVIGGGCIFGCFWRFKYGSRNAKYPKDIKLYFNINFWTLYTTLKKEFKLLNWTLRITDVALKVHYMHILECNIYLNIYLLLLYLSDKK